MARPRLRLVSVVLLVCASMVVASSAWAAYRDVPRRTWAPNGDVYAVVKAGDRVYLGGSFTNLRSPTTGETVTRTNLAALDAATGELVRSWNPSTDAVVRAIAVSADEARVFVGGDFLNVNGQGRQRLAALDTASGALVPGWNGRASQRVKALTALGTRLYLGGEFGGVNGVTRTRLGAVTQATGALEPWAPAANSTVNALAPSSDGTTIVVGGSFRTLSGQSRDYLGSVDLAGAVTTWRPPAGCIDANPCLVFDLAITPTRVYAAVAGPGGRGIAYSTTTGARIWEVRADGDVQAVAYADGIVYFGGHYDPIFAGQTRRQLAAVSAATGALDPNFAPLQSSPYPGVLDIAADSAYLRVGGHFTNVGGTGQSRYAEYPVAITAPTYPYVSQGDSWRYLDNYSDQGVAWRADTFNDSAWPVGTAQLGFGDGDEATTTRSGGITTYFRKTFDVADPSALSSLQLSLLRDDGAVVYINGTELVRDNLPGGTIGFRTAATTAVAGTDESAWRPFNIPTSALRPGSNVITVEVHNSSTGSSDISFDLALTGVGPL